MLGREDQFAPPQPERIRPWQKCRQDANLPENLN